MAHTWYSPNWVVRASGRCEELVRSMQRVMEETDPLLPFASFRTIDSLRDQSLASQRFQAGLLAIFAGLALLLASVGIYGLIATSVTERRRELGIRMALGATLSNVIANAAAPGVLLAAAGVAVGCLLARVAVHLVESFVYGVKPTDPATFAVVAAGLLAVAAAASLIASLRLLRLNPASTLREE